MLKANYNRAVFEDSDEAGIGVVFQNSRGEVMAALSEKILLPPTGETLELMAARRAAKLAVELGYYWVVLKDVRDMFYVIG